jgi:diadenosine tetraphosphate (Ap4A) HIT family hydrolase
VLTNYAPIVLGSSLHFLIVPKEHRTGFFDLEESEYVEAMKFSEKLIAYYSRNGLRTAYLFDKTGAEAGQTVPHWHQHVVFTATKTQEILGKLRVFKNLLWRPSPLPENRLQTRVHNLRGALGRAFVLRGNLDKSIVGRS